MLLNTLSCFLSFRSFLEDDREHLWHLQHTNHSVWMDLLNLGCHLFLVNCNAYLHCVYDIQKVNVHLEKVKKKGSMRMLGSCYNGVWGVISVPGMLSDRCTAATRFWRMASSSAGFWMFCLTLAGFCYGTESKCLI